MRIAALIIAHHKPELVAFLLQRLDTSLWQPFLHVDAKADGSLFPRLP